jgi:hypothetical protein
MTIKRLPTILFAVGIALKAVEVILWRYFQPSLIYSLAVTYDPLAFWFANATIARIFDQWRIFPELLKPTLFDLLQIIGFGLECLIVGFMVQMLRGWFRRRGTGGVARGPQVSPA